MFGYREFGGTGVNLRSVIVDLLAMQPQQMWVLGACEYETYFQYSFENDNLLTALLSLAEPLEGEHLWTFDTDAKPFILHLTKASAQDASEMRRSRNMSNLKIDIDRSGLGTRLYPLGYGEGVNQLTIAEANGGIKYLDADTQSAWGVVSTVYAETSVTEAATLKAMALTVLERIKNPKVTVTVSGDDLSALTGEPLDRFYPGRMCRAPLPDYGVVMDGRVVSIAKPDVFGNNTKVTVTLANKGQNSVDQMAALSRKTAIGELYSQGSTNQYALTFADNADESNPATMRFYIDPDAVHINKVVCRYDLEAFRSYSKGAASGGGSTSGGGGASTETTTQRAVSNTALTGSPVHADDGNKSKAFTDSGGAGDSSHTHGNVHAHNVFVEITIPPLSISIPGHTHPTPNHTHNDNPGIYRGSTASSATIKVDGTSVPASAIANGEFDAVPYLAKDSGGRITRGTWHNITIAPNELTRIVADLHVKTFIRSISGGNY